MLAPPDGAGGAVRAFGASRDLDRGKSRWVRRKRGKGRPKKKKKRATCSKSIFFEEEGETIQIAR